MEPLYREHVLPTSEVMLTKCPSRVVFRLSFVLHQATRFRHTRHPKNTRLGKCTISLVPNNDKKIIE